jgi:hypothetical protein
LKCNFDQVKGIGPLGEELVKDLGSTNLTQLHRPLWANAPDSAIAPARRLWRLRTRRIELLFP